MRKILIPVFFACVITMFAGCTNPAGTPGSGNGNAADGIKWETEDGTLTVANNTAKDMILFQGQTPTVNNIIGGIRGSSTKTFDISDDVDDFEIGGYMILRGMTKEQYEANKADLSKAKVEYSAMATYGQGKKFRTEISAQYAGDYYFKITNGGRLGIELRKNSPDGEKIGYLPSLATNYALYSNSSDDITIFPVYVFYNNVNKTVTTIRASSFADSVSVAPRPVTDSSVATTRLPNDPSISWEAIVDTIIYPVAFITVTNNVQNQSARFAKSSTVIKGQNGYDSLNSGETNTFEIESTDAGTETVINCTLYGGTVVIPVKAEAGSAPTIKNGYDYTVTLKFSGGKIDEASSYTATITEGVKRDVKDAISSL